MHHKIINKRKTLNNLLKKYNEQSRKYKWITTGGTVVLFCIEGDSIVKFISWWYWSIDNSRITNRLRHHPTKIDTSSLLLLLRTTISLQYWFYLSYSTSFIHRVITEQYCLSYNKNQCFNFATPSNISEKREVLYNYIYIFCLTIFVNL